MHTPFCKPGDHPAERGTGPDLSRDTRDPFAVREHTPFAPPPAYRGTSPSAHVYSAHVVGAAPMQEDLPAPPPVPQNAGYALPSAADVVTLTSYGLGLWWAFGGPTWAGVASIVGDELDGHIARKLGTTSERGANLDWGADVALVPAALHRLGKATGVGPAMLLAAPPVLLAQAAMRAEGVRPRVGSARALIMLATMAVERFK